MKRIDPRNLDAEIAARLEIYETTADDVEKDEILACAIGEPFVVMNRSGIPNSAHGSSDYLVIGPAGAGACAQAWFGMWYSKSGPYRGWMNQYISEPVGDAADPT